MAFGQETVAHEKSEPGVEVIGWPERLALPEYTGWPMVIKK